MKQTINVNICQSQFILDIDAFEMLRDYLDTLSKVFSNNPDRNELISDIENRIAELLMERVSPNAPVITLPTMESVIAQIGRPQDLSETEEVIEETPRGESVYQRQFNTQLPPLPPGKTRKRLFRSVSDRMLGGVCGGIAAYLGVDSTWIRLATVALCFLSFSMVGLVYIVLWLVVPEAKTPLEQMQMRGEQPTLRNIADSISNSFREGYGSMPTPATGNTAGPFARTLGGIAGVLAYIILGFVTFAIGSAALIFFCAFVVGLICTIQYWTFGSASVMFMKACSIESLDLVPPTTLALFCLFIVFAIPTVVLIRLLLNKSSKSSTTTKVAILLIWIAALIASIFSFGYVASLEDAANPPVSTTVDVSTDTVSKTDDDTVTQVVSDTTSIQVDSVAVNQ